MKAIKMQQFGSPEVLKVEEVQIKRPGQSQVLIHLAAAGVNFIDISSTNFAR